MKNKSLTFCWTLEFNSLIEQDYYRCEKGKNMVVYNSFEWPAVIFCTSLFSCFPYTTVEYEHLTINVEGFCPKLDHTH